MAKLTKEMLQKELDGLTAQAGQVQANALFEAGKAVGRVEGQQALLKALVAVADPDAEVLKLVEAGSEQAPQ